MDLPAKPPTSILIVKTSSLGDIIQSFAVLNYLFKRFPHAKIDWAVEKLFAPIVKAHPLVHEAISLDMKEVKKNWRSLPLFLKEIVHLRKKRYDLIFDLQGNCKSGALTLISKGKIKVGFGPQSVREWPNLLATNVRFNVPKQINIRLQHLRLLQQFFRDSSSTETEGVRFLIDEEEKRRLATLLQKAELQTPLKIMVCPGSKWENKQLSLEALVAFLKKIKHQLRASFLLMWGEEAERSFCEKVHGYFPKESLVVEKLSIPTWQNLMNEVDLVVAVDSSALHLCGTTSTPSFSVFGPTSPDIFKPIGHRHFAFQGKCPYHRTFEKSCPLLRSCSTGGCIRHLSGEEIFLSFHKWWHHLKSASSDHFR